MAKEPTTVMKATVGASSDFGNDATDLYAYRSISNPVGNLNTVAITLSGSPLPKFELILNERHAMLIVAHNRRPPLATSILPRNAGMSNTAVIEDLVWENGM